MFGEPRKTSSEAEALTKFIDGLYSYAMALTRNSTFAEDLVQETYVRAIPAIGRLREDSNIKGWMFTILRNIWLSEVRQARNRLHVTGTDINQYPEDAAVAQDPHELLIRRMDQEYMRDAIEQLPGDFREVILLREYGELSYQEVAEVLSCPIGTVMSRLGRARSKLRAIYESHL
jgi:RNA polymerase sigma-70 factor (ECF subfamily)